VFEQKIYRVDNDDDRGIGLFARVSSSPSDRNPIDFYADGGVELIGLSDRRPKDKLGIAAGYAHVSSKAHAPARPRVVPPSGAKRNRAGQVLWHTEPIERPLED
jgi:carbohydrate-selective porin OprB